MEYKYWKIWYVSCEGNDRWVIARTFIDWEEYQVHDRIPMGGCGDDVAEITSIDETDNENYLFDFVEPDEY